MSLALHDRLDHPCPAASESNDQYKGYASSEQSKPSYDDRRPSDSGRDQYSSSYTSSYAPSSYSDKATSYSDDQAAYSDAQSTYTGGAQTYESAGTKPSTYDAPPTRGSYTSDSKETYGLDNAGDANAGYSAARKPARRPAPATSSYMTGYEETPLISPKGLSTSGLTGADLAQLEGLASAYTGDYTGAGAYGGKLAAAGLTLDQEAAALAGAYNEASLAGYGASGYSSSYVPPPSTYSALGTSGYGSSALPASYPSSYGAADLGAYSSAAAYPAADPYAAAASAYPSTYASPLYGSPRALRPSYGPASPAYAASSYVKVRIA